MFTDGSVYQHRCHTMSGALLGTISRSTKRGACFTIVFSRRTKKQASFCSADIKTKLKGRNGRAATLAEEMWMPCLEEDAPNPVVSALSVGSMLVGESASMTITSGLRLPASKRNESQI